LLCIHYSDSWADPSHQTIPAAWTSTTNTALVEKVYTYTKEVLTELKENDAAPDFVQLGNEISYGMLWRNESDRCYANASATTWKRLANFLNSAGNAVREVTPEAKIVLHIERSGDVQSATRFFNYMNTYNVDYDIIGLSYYPFWHKDLATLGNTLNTLETNYPSKPVQIVETAYYYQYFPTSSDYDDTTGTWPATAAGQKAFIEDLCTELAQHANVTGLYYWFPEANGSGQNYSILPPGSSNNRGLWNESTHKLNSGVLSLKKFLTEKETVNIEEKPSADQCQTGNATYTLGGQQVSDITSTGVYLRGKKKYWVK
jgi:arabinogalactan endo-1,4-beta-galactosidase